MYDPQSRWFQSQARQRQSAGNTKKRQIPLTLELLEDRTAPAVFNVNTTVDLSNPGPGLTTLRSAILNSGPGNNTINLSVAGDYLLTSGELPIAASNGGSLVINNTSGGVVTVDGNHNGRVFDINPLDSI